MFWLTFRPFFCSFSSSSFSSFSICRPLCSPLNHEANTYGIEMYIFLWNRCLSKVVHFSYTEILNSIHTREALVLVNISFKISNLIDTFKIFYESQHVSLFEVCWTVFCLFILSQNSHGEVCHKFRNTNVRTFIESMISWQYSIVNTESNINVSLNCVTGENCSFHVI